MPGKNTFFLAVRVSKKAPLSCYGQQDRQHAICQSCPHRTDCAAVSFTDRVTLDRLTFELIPPALQKKWRLAETQALDATYQATYRLVFGSNPGHTLGRLEPEIRRKASQAKVRVNDYILINMVAFQLAWPDREFTPRCLVDNRALYRTALYADACIKKYGSLDVTSLDNLTNQDNAAYDLGNRMLRSECAAGRWIIEWKLTHEGPPYDALFDALETTLDVNWLAIEPRFFPRLQRYFLQLQASPDQHELAEKLIVLKRRPQEAFANFKAREMALPTAISNVLNSFGFTPQDFLREDRPVTDALLLWHRLALAIQHLECLRWTRQREGYYAGS